jgi:hypothetical protein
VEELRDGRELHEIRHDGTEWADISVRGSCQPLAIVRRNGNEMDLGISDEERKMK